MAQNLYEGMFLVDSQRFASDPDAVSQTIVGILEKAGAEVVAHRPWQDGRLAYEVEGRRRGLHYLTLFKMDGRGLTDVDRSVRLNDTVLRHMVIKQPEAIFEANLQAMTGHETVIDGETGERKPKPKPKSEGGKPSEGEADAKPAEAKATEAATAD